jgi:hypothetical protein
MVLVDDSAENALDASQADPPVRVLLFGDYPWNAVVKKVKSSIPAAGSSRAAGNGHGEAGEEDLDELPYVEKEKRGLLARSAERRKALIAEGWLPEGVKRVRDWNAVIKWVQENGGK